MEIKIFEKRLIKPGETHSDYLIFYTADGNKLYQELTLANDLPDEFLIQWLEKTAKRILKNNSSPVL